MIEARERSLGARQEGNALLNAGRRAHTWLRLGRASAADETGGAKKEKVTAGQSYFVKHERNTSVISILCRSRLCEAVGRACVDKLRESKFFCKNLMRTCSMYRTWRIKEEECCTS